MKTRLQFLLISCLLMNTSSTHAQPAGLGMFTSHADIGKVLKPGSAAYDPTNGVYLVAGGAS